MIRAVADGRHRHDGRHVVVGQIEIEDLHVVGDAVRMGRFRHRHDAVLQGEADADLRDALAVFGGDFRQRRIGQDGAAAQRRPRLDDHVVRLAPTDKLRLVVARMELDLVHHRLDFSRFEQRVQLFRQVVRHADGADLAVLVHLLEAAPRRRVDFLPFRIGFRNTRPMNKIQIQIIDAQILQ